VADIVVCQILHYLNTKRNLHPYPNPNTYSLFRYLLLLLATFFTLPVIIHGMLLLALCWSRDCRMSNADRQLQTMAASSVLFGFGSGQLVAGDACFGCLVPYQHHRAAYLRTAVSSRLVATSQRRSSEALCRPPVSMQCHRPAGCIDAAYLSDFGKASSRSFLIVDSVKLDHKRKRVTHVKRNEKDILRHWRTRRHGWDSFAATVVRNCIPLPRRFPDHRPPDLIYVVTSIKFCISFRVDRRISLSAPARYPLCSKHFTN